MTHRSSEHPRDVERVHPSEKLAYEPPKLLPLGNARELLAAFGGTQTDAQDPGETQSGG
jgi:hypothetical protein